MPILSFRQVALIIVTYVTVIFLSACQTIPTTIPTKIGEAWYSPRGKDHPLQGTVWRMKDRQQTSLNQILHEAKRANDVLIGEKHDNVDHHQIQAWFVDQLATADHIVGFEMIDEDQQGVLDQHLSSAEVSELGKLLSWDKSGWPEWEMYQPIFQAALRHHARLIWGSLAKEKIKSIVRKGPDQVLDVDYLTPLALDKILSPEMKKVKAVEIRQSHCDMLPETMVDPMVITQTLKDAVLTQNLASAARSILIAGAGHVRNDRGVPYHFANRFPERKIISIGLVEVYENRLSLNQYGDLYDSTALPFDYVIFTPGNDDLPPCEAYKEQLKLIAEKHKASHPTASQETDQPHPDLIGDKELSQ